MNTDTLNREFDRLQGEAVRLAGGLTDLSQRASVYRHLFLASGGNHAFPLIAAHGALWAGGYFRFGLSLGRALSWQYIGQPELRQRQLQKLNDFADVFRDINRRVCVDSYVNFHFTQRYGEQARAVEFIPGDLLEPLNRMHAASRAGIFLQDNEKQQIFEAHFLHEQTHVVGPTLNQAVAAFDWPLIRAIALRPLVRFSYFPVFTKLSFRDFSSQEERIEKGLAAFSIASSVGWGDVDSALKRYRILPDDFFSMPALYFNELKRSILSA